MNLSRIGLVGLYLAVALLTVSSPAFAWKYYSADFDTGNCANCHGAFRSGTYESDAEGISWGDHLHNVHLNETDVDGSPNGTCDSCHGGADTVQRQVNLASSGVAKDGVNAISCMGCHGRFEDENSLGFFGNGWGAGLRQHHFTSSDPGAANACGACHADSNPANFTTAGEDVLPPWYASVTHTDTGLAMDSCNASANEDFSGDGTGLDNDGDQDYDLSDADCAAPVVSISGDGDGDGTSDILWRNGANGQNSLWLMANGERSGQQLVPTVSDTNWKIIGRGDHDGDGTADILWRKSNPGQPDDGQMAIWLMQGGTRTANLGLPSVPGTDWQVVGSGDYNGDGDDDVLWRNVSNGQNAMWRIVDGALDANLYVPSVANLSWTVVGDGDFDNDGNDDILWRNTTNGRMALWRMDGATRLANEGVPRVADLNWVVFADGDYDGDGDADIFWRNTSTGLNAMWLMNGATMDNNLPVLSFSSQDWQVAGADSDFDGDGMSDLYWRNTATGDNSIWLMSSQNRVGHFSIPAVPIGDWEVAPVE